MVGPGGRGSGRGSTVFAVLVVPGPGRDAAGITARVEGGPLCDELELGQELDVLYDPRRPSRGLVLDLEPLGPHRGAVTPARLLIVGFVLAASSIAAAPAAGRGLRPLRDASVIQGPGDYERVLEAGGRSRRYEVHAPPRAAGARPLPVVLNFHGGGGNAKAARRSTRMDPVADRHGFLVVYPEGTGRLRRALLTFNAGICCAHAMTHGVDDVGFVRALLDDLSRFFRVDPRRVYATGLSNGGMMAYRLACELGDRVAAVASVAGTLGLRTCNPERPVPVMHVHGTADRNLPYGGGFGPRSVATVLFLSVDETMSFWRAANRSLPGAPAVTRRAHVTTVTYRPGPGGAEVVLVRIEGGGHVWPGGDPLLPAWVVGTDAGGIDASELVWRFLAPHVLAGP